MAQYIDNNMHHDDNKQNVTIILQFNQTIGLCCRDKNQLNITKHFIHSQFAISPCKYSTKPLILMICNTWRHPSPRRIAKPGYVFLTHDTRIEPLLVIEINVLTWLVSYPYVRIVSMVTVSHYTVWWVVTIWPYIIVTVRYSVTQGNNWKLSNKAVIL